MDDVDELWHELNRHWSGIDKLTWWCKHTELQSGLRQWVTFIPEQDQYVIHMSGIKTAPMQYFIALRMIRDNGVAVMSYRLQGM